MVTQDSSKWYRGNITSWWGFQHRDLDYRNEPFNNPSDLARWQELGFTQTVFTGDMYDMRNPEPEWYDGVEAYFKTWRNVSWSFYRMHPGTILPLHSDTYARYKQIYQLPDTSKIWRAVIFLEDWTFGHYVGFENINITHWKAGDVWKFTGHEWHYAVNASNVSFHTCQVSTFK